MFDWLCIFFILNHTQAIERLLYFSCHAESEACGLMEIPFDGQLGSPPIV
jgi:hypothetical protein